MLANERGRARQAQAGAKAPVLADEQWAVPAVPVSTDQTIVRVGMDNFNCVPRPKFLCRSIGKVLGMNIITSNIPPLHSYDRCEQIFTLFFCLI